MTEPATTTCPKSKTGHQGDYTTATLDTTSAFTESVLVDIQCRHCGCWGSFLLEDRPGTRIDWEREPNGGRKG